MPSPDNPPHLPNENGAPQGPRAGPVFLVTPSVGAWGARHAQAQDREELGDATQHQMRPFSGRPAPAAGAGTKGDKYEQSRQVGEAGAGRRCLLLSG